MSSAGLLLQSTPLLLPDRGAEGASLPRRLIIGIGNPDREDDGVAWVLLNRLAGRLDSAGCDMGDESERSFEDGRVLLLFSLQIMPEMATVVADFDQICFVDAHTGSEPEDLYWQEVVPEFQASPLTHHMTPATCLSLVNTLYGKQPAANLLAVRGFSFEFSQSLSPQTAALADQAEQILWDWLWSKNR